MAFKMKGFSGFRKTDPPAKAPAKTAPEMDVHDRSGKTATGLAIQGPSSKRKSKEVGDKEFKTEAQRAGNAAAVAAGEMVREAASHVNTDTSKSKKQKRWEKKAIKASERREKKAARKSRRKARKEDRR